MTPHPLRPGEVLFCLIVLGLALVAFREAYAISGFSGLTTGGVMPMAAATVMIVSGAFILKDALARRSGAPVSLFATVGFLFPRRLVLFAAFLALYAMAIPWIGFFPASTVFLFASILALWRRGVFWAAGVTAAAILVIYGVFRLIFQVVLPTGLMWQ